jgi:23S rRNA pseudouridine1911/1915/1917 synthase
VPEECAGWRLDAALARLFPEHSRSRLQGWLKHGLIRIDGAIAATEGKVRRRARRF